MGDNGPGPSCGQLPGTKAARVTGLLMLVPEQSGLGGRQATGDQDLGWGMGGKASPRSGGLDFWVFQEAGGGMGSGH